MDCHEQWEPRGTIKIIQLSVTIINDELDVCGEWSKEKLLILLRNKLLKHDENHDLCDENGDEIFNNIISRGIYSKAVISKLLKNGKSYLNSYETYVEELFVNIDVYYRHIEATNG